MSAETLYPHERGPIPRTVGLLLRSMDSEQLILGRNRDDGKWGLLGTELQGDENIRECAHRAFAAGTGLELGVISIADYPYVSLQFSPAHGFFISATYFARLHRPTAREGFDPGGNLDLVKPFSPKELAMLLKQSESIAQPELHKSPIEMWLRFYLSFKYGTFREDVQRSIMEDWGVVPPEDDR